MFSGQQYIANKKNQPDSELSMSDWTGTRNFILDYHNVVPMGLKKKLHRSEVMLEKFNSKDLSPFRDDIIQNHVL